MIHVLDYKGNIIDFISQDDSAVISAVHHRNINERTETFDFTILSERAVHLQDRNRVIIQDSNEQYREFIIEHISQDVDGYTEVETSASYLEDISTSVPYAPGKLTSMTTSQAMLDVLKDTGWKVSDKTEYGGTRSTSWTSFQTRYEVLMQLCTTYSMVPDFYIEIGTNKVEGRYVVLKKRNAIFNGKEIVYGKDLVEMKRTVDMTEINTALLASGPQKEDGTPPITLTVKDDEANNRYSLPGRYLWGIYSPETEDEDMTEARLRTLATTELNKRKAAAISYEVKGTDIKRYYPHEVIRIGDKIRVKNEDFTPSLYLEAEVIGEDYNLISGDSEYAFGEYKEFTESELKKAFEQRLRDIQKKLTDNINNINTIIQETQTGNLEYFEKKIIKSSTPPPNPVNDMLWYDTSNPNVAVVRRYWNGQWIESTAENVEQIGGVTREKALYSELNNTFINLTIQHSRLLSDVYEVVNSEYLVDKDLRDNVNAKLNDTVAVFNAIKSNLESMKPETATIGKLVDTQALFLSYREKMQALYTAVENAKLAIDRRFKLLQSQYTDEKFNDAMQKVAEGIGGTWDKDKGQLIASLPDNEEMENAIKAYLSGNIDSLVGETVDSKLKVLKEEVSSSISSVERKVDGFNVGGRNLIRNSDKINLYGEIKKVLESFIYLKSKQYVLSFDISIPPMQTTEKIYIDFQLTKVDGTKGTIKKEIDITKIANPSNAVATRLFVVFDADDYLALEGIIVDSSKIPGSIIANFQLEQGNVPTAYQKAPEDVDDQINAVQTKTNTDIKQLKDSITLKADKSEVKTIFDDNIKPLQTQVNDQKAQLDILPAQINSKVSQSTYTADQNNIISKLNSAETQRQQLSNAINDRVTINQFNNLKVGSRNLLMNTRGPFTSNVYQVRDFYTTEKISVGDTVTLSVKGDFGSDRTAFLVYNSGGMVQIGTLVTADKNKNGIFTKTFTWADTRADGSNKVDSSFLRIYQYPSGGTSSSNIEWIKLERGTVPTDYTVAPEDTDKTLTTMQTQITQNGNNINLRATKDEFNATNKTLSKVISDITVNTTKGIDLTYNENGTIQSSTVGPNGISLRGDKVDITVNKDFQVMSSTVNNKVGKNEVVNSINLSKEGIAIDANKVGIRGGDGTTYLDIQNTKLLSRGFFDRTWGEVTDRPYCKLGIYDGYLITQNENTGKNLYMTEKGLSTTMAGNLKGTSGTLEFHFKNPFDDTDGVRLHSYYGMVYIQSQENKLYMRSGQTINIETADAGIYLRPYLKSRGALNDFSFKVTDASDWGLQDGLLVYGEISDPAGIYGSGLRFRKKGLKGHNGDEYEPMVSATDMAGNAGMGSFTALNFYGNVKSRTQDLYLMADATQGEVKATSFLGYNNGSPNYIPVRASRIATNSALAFTNNNDSDVFFGNMPNRTFCFTDINGYNGGKPAYQSIRAKEYLPGSLAEYKRNIKEWNGDALKEIVNSQLHEYNYKNDEKDEKTRHGFVIGDQYATPDNFIDGDGVRTYEMIAYLMRAVQQLNEKLEESINGTK